MFGKGIYLADMASKSANYCCSHLSGNTGLLLLCESELGDPMYTLTNASYNAGDEAQAKGMYSTWGQGKTGPSKWKDASCINPNLKGVKIVSATPLGITLTYNPSPTPTSSLAIPTFPGPICSTTNTLPTRLHPPFFVTC
jgi:hypothetical protein